MLFRICNADVTLKHDNTWRCLSSLHSGWTKLWVSQGLPVTTLVCVTFIKPPRVSVLLSLGESDHDNQPGPYRYMFGRVTCWVLGGPTIEHIQTYEENSGEILWFAQVSSFWLTLSLVVSVNPKLGCICTICSNLLLSLLPVLQGWKELICISDLCSLEGNCQMDICL